MLGPDNTAQRMVLEAYPGRSSANMTSGRWFPITFTVTANSGLLQKQVPSHRCVCGPFPRAPKGPSVLHLHVYLSLPFLRMGSESVGGGERKLKGW